MSISHETFSITHLTKASGESSPGGPIVFREGPKLPTRNNTGNLQLRGLKKFR